MSPSSAAAPGLAARCEGLVRIYWSASGEVHALKGIDAAFPEGTLTAVVGPSGSGKSSLLRILAALDRPTAGQVSVAGTDLTVLSRRRMRRLRRMHIGYVFQRPSHNLVPYLTAREHIQHAASVRRIRRVDAEDVLDRLGLAARADHRPRELSGGEQQRLAVAQAMVGDPRLVIADEPTAELDSKAGATLLDSLRQLAASGAAVVLSTHDGEAVRVADQTLFLHHGAVQAERTGTDALAVIDAAGRVQLPPDVLVRFPERRAVLHLTEDGVVLQPPSVQSSRAVQGDVDEGEPPR